MGFSRQECWSGLPFPSPGDLPDLGTEPRYPALEEDTLPSEPPGKPLGGSDGNRRLITPDLTPQRGCEDLWRQQRTAAH